MSLTTTPSANRLHIGIFGKVNSGKSSFLNAFVGQDVSIVAAVAGTTTDVVTKAMEVPQLGPCVFLDTAGFDDNTELGEARVERTRLAADKCDMAIIVIASTSKSIEEEKKWYSYFKGKKISVLVLVNRVEDGSENRLLDEIKTFCDDAILTINAKSKEGIAAVRETLARNIPENFELPFITGDLTEEGDVVMLVMPQDAQAPKGRLILPQVQTTRELLDKKCVIISVTPDKMKSALEQLKNPPKLIITDSQVFHQVYEMKPQESMLTSFSVLFAGYKGDLNYYVESAKAIDQLTEESKILIAECCTHAPATEDIGRVKIPNMLRKRYGEDLQIDIVSGTDFPQDVSGYNLVIQCGGCMFNRRYILSRIEKAKSQNIPMTNYGIAIAYLTGILDKISF